MAQIRRSNTKPELIVRRMLHRAGYRFRVQLKGVPGRPDVAFTARKKALMVHGCFWHQHQGCRHSRVPASRAEFWQAKFNRNRERDSRLKRAAEELGWEVLVIWECETKDPEKLAVKLLALLGPTRISARCTGRTGQSRPR